MPVHSSSSGTLTRFCRFPLTFNLPLLASVTNFHLCSGVWGGAKASNDAKVLPMFPVNL
jgi:hypothetical protein